MGTRGHTLHKHMLVDGVTQGPLDSLEAGPPASRLS